MREVAVGSILAISMMLVCVVGIFAIARFAFIR